MTNLPNNTAAVETTFTAFAKAEIAHDKAITKLVDALVSEGVVADDIKGTGSNAGRYVAAFMAGVAKAVLTPTQHDMWANAELATKVKGELTERGKLMTRVSSRASKVRAAFERELKARDKAEVATTSDGAGAPKRGPADVDLEKLLTVQARIAGLVKQDKAEGYKNPEAILTALQNAIDAFK